MRNPYTLTLLLLFLVLVPPKEQLPGTLEILDLETGHVHTATLAEHGASVTVGREGNISLDDDALPAIAGKLFTRISDVGSEVVGEVVGGRVGAKVVGAGVG